MTTDLNLHAATARRDRTWQLGSHAVLLIGAVFILTPFVFMTIVSLTPANEIYRSGFLPSRVSLEHYLTVFREVPIGRYYRNSLIVTTSMFFLQIVIALPAAYALARLRFKGSQLGLWVVLLSLIIPPQATAVPVYVALAEMGLLDTRRGLLLPFIGSAFGVFLLRQYLLTVPSSLFDAARIDGAGINATIWRVALPAVRPAILAFGIFSVVFHWNDLFWPSLTLRTDAAATIPFGIARFSLEEAGTLPGPSLAMAVVMIVPLLGAFLLVQRHFIEGMALSGSQE